MPQSESENEPVLESFLRIYHKYLHDLGERGVEFDPDAERYLMTFLRRGSAVVRRRAEADPSVARSAEFDAEDQLYHAANAVAQAIVDYGIEQVQPQHVEAALRDICGTGYPPFCDGGPEGGAPPGDPAESGPGAAASSDQRSQRAMEAE